MKKYKKLQLLAVACIVFVAALYIWNTGAAKQKGVKPPKVVSLAKSIEIISVKVAEPDSLVVTVLNNSEKSVVAITLQTGDGKDDDAVTVAGFQEGDEPDKVIIQPHETYDLDMPISYIRPGNSVRVSGVLYADDTEEGVKDTIGLIRAEKKKIKVNRIKREGGGPQ